MSTLTLQGNPIARLKDGDSVLFETSRDGGDNKYRELKLACLDFSVHHGGKFEVRKVVGGIRVWRLKPEDSPVRIERKRVSPPPPISMETELPKPKVQKKGCPVIELAKPVEQTSHCSRCKQDKPLSEFNKRVGAKNGVQTYCRKCNSEYLKERTESKKLKAVNVALPAAEGETKVFSELFKGDAKVASAVYTLTDAKKKSRPRVPVPYVEPVKLSIWGRLKKIVGL